MNSLAYIPASDGAANASLMTVTNVRAPGATTLQVNTVANAPTRFYASMGTPNTFTDPVTSETITVISEATAVDFAGTIDGSNVEIVEIAPGYTDAGSEVGDIIVIRPVTEWANNIFNTLSVVHEDDGTLKDDVVDTAAIQNGAVTPEKMRSLVAFRVAKSSAQSVSASTFTTITWQTEKYDVGEDFDLGQNGFVAPYNGIYHFDAQWTCGSSQAATRKAITFTVNGTDVFRNEYGADVFGSAGSCDLKLNAGDVVTVRAYGASNAVTVDANDNFTFFTGHLITVID